MYTVTFWGADGKQYSYDDVDLLPTDSQTEIIQKVSAKHTEQMGDPNPLFVTRILSQIQSKK